MSETDAAVEPFFGGKAETSIREQILKVSGHGPKTPVEEADIDSFFAHLTAIRDWYTADQKRNTRRFATLEHLLRDELSDLYVFRIGRIRIDIYVVGVDRNGDLRGIKTKAVET